MAKTASIRNLAVIGVLCLLASLMTVGSARAQDPPPEEGSNRALQLSGDTNTATAIAWSQLSFPPPAIEDGNGPTELIVGRDDVFADNLASGSLQNGTDTGRPLLLTDTATLSPDTAAEIDRLDGGDTVEKIFILGGENAVSPAVEAVLMADYEVERLEGPTRIETAIEIAKVTFEDQGPGGVVYLARAFGGDDPTQAFADSLALGGWAANNGVPILLTQTEVLTGNTEAYLDEADITKIEIIGGTAAVSQDVEDTLNERDEEIIRIGGENRFETATDIAAARGFESADDDEITILVDGQDPDAWADGFAAARTSGDINSDDPESGGYPIVLSNGDDLPTETQEYLGDSSTTTGGMEFAAHFTGVVLICGTSVADAACEDAADRLDATVEDFPGEGVEILDVQPQTTETLAPESTSLFGIPIIGSSDSDADDRQFTVDGLDPEQAYRITLVLEENVETGSGGTATFVDEDDDGNADPGASEEVAVITMVNGEEPQNPDDKTTPSPEDDPDMPSGEFPNDDGTLTFTIDGEGEGSVYAVVYVNQGESTFLEIDESGSPIESYGVSGLTIYDEDAA